MGLVGIALLVILVVSAILLVLIVLIQDEEGEGIGGLFGGGSSTPFGSRSGNVLTRFTAVLAAIFLFCAFALAWINRTPDSGNVIGKARQQNIQQAESKNWWVEQSSAPAAPAPAGGGGTTTPVTPATTPVAPTGGK